MTSEQLTRLTDEVLRAPRLTRWSTLSDMSAFDRPLVLNELVDRFAKSEELKAGYLRDLGDTTKACDSLRRDLKGRDVSLEERDNRITELQATVHALEKHADQLRKELDERRPLGVIEVLNMRQDIKRLSAQLNEAEKAVQALSSENERAKSTIEAKNRLLDERAARITELNLGIARAQDVRQDRQTDARLFLELIHLGRTVDDARAVLAAANDIRKNGLTPQT